ncbi:hypothetical protein MRX96_021716 [Rhipicephalus microplus]
MRGERLEDAEKAEEFRKTHVRNSAAGEATSGRIGGKNKRSVLRSSCSTRDGDDPRKLLQGSQRSEANITTGSVYSPFFSNWANIDKECEGRDLGHWSGKAYTVEPSTGLWFRHSATVPGAISSRLANVCRPGSITTKRAGL